MIKTNTEAVSKISKQKKKKKKNSSSVANYIFFYLALLHNTYRYIYNIYVCTGPPLKASSGYCLNVLLNCYPKMFIRKITVNTKFGIKVVLIR